MAFDTPRKTLGEIRGEIDADFGEAAIPQAASDADIAGRSHVADNDGPAARMRRVAPVRDETDDDPATQRFYAALTARAEGKLRRKPTGYLIAGLIGCVIGQIVLLGFMGLGRGEQRTGATSTAVTAAQETPTSGAISSPPPSVSSPMKPPSGSSSTPESASASAAPPPEPVVNDPKPMPSGVMKRAAPELSSHSSVSAARSASQVSPQSRARLKTSQNLATAQQEVRAALSHWLRVSGRVEHSFISDAVVILGADGRTARTQVPTRWGHRIVIREQRWEQAARGWRLIDDRDPSQER